MATPQWLQDVIANTQKIQDAKDADNLKKYDMAAADWVTNNVMNRDQGRALTAPPSLPTITTFYDAGGYMDGRTVPNPAAKPPVLPPPATTQPNQPGFGGTGAGARDEMLFQILMAIQRDIAQVKAVIVPNQGGQS